ncbi:hypothetical protein [Candidatus Cryosericum septentrionale]|jgi:hypothetical protein|uniref:hypothetical protein n=1 Tax=Candidatus Cryosericum septentrionale TaxID=2290913 RepID=UPI0014030709|nr:hypothetical protein [Candidatus Cryosericum septentrionale]
MEKLDYKLLRDILYQLIVVKHLAFYDTNAIEMDIKHQLDLLNEIVFNMEAKK